jgi:hypothetical protein
VFTHQPSGSSVFSTAETGAANASIGKTSIVKQKTDIVARLNIIVSP